MDTLFGLNLTIRLKRTMDITEKIMSDDLSEDAGNREPQKIDSSFQLIVVAALRNKQLQSGAIPRIEANLGRRRNTNIAIEETKRGLVYYKVTDEHK